jgi:hypothetical protein
MPHPGHGDRRHVERVEAALHARANALGGERGPADARREVAHPPVEGRIFEMAFRDVETGPRRAWPSMMVNPAVPIARVIDSRRRFKRFVRLRQKKTEELQVRVLPGEPDPVSRIVRYLIDFIMCA